MLYTKMQILHMCINLVIILLGIGLTFLAIRVTKLKDAQSRLIFVLYMVFWIPTLMCRDYTGLMLEHAPGRNMELVIFIPLLMYGVVGLIWRPLVDFLSFKFKSRRTIIFITLGLQLATFVPYIFYPCFATNLLQSIGCGIGASCIGLFNLMFDDRQSKETVFKTVSVLSIPPILAQLIASAFESLITSREPVVYTHSEYVEIVLSLWAIAVVLIVACFVLTAFVKPKPKLLYIAKKQKTQIHSKTSWLAYILLCVCAMLVVFVRWTTAGPTTGIQVAYIATLFGTDTRFYEGYTGLIYTLGQLAGTIIAGYLLNSKNKNQDKVRIILVISSCAIGILYCILGGCFLTIAPYMSLLSLSGLSYGLIYPVIIGIAVQKVFFRQKYMTPVGLLNTFLALGICLGLFVVGAFKAPVFDQIHGFSTYSFNDFKDANWFIMSIDIIMLVLVVGCYIGSHFIYKKHPDKKVTLKHMANMMGDTEM